MTPEGFVMKFGPSLLALTVVLLATGCSSAPDPGSPYAGRVLEISCSGSAGSYLASTSIDVENTSGKTVANVRLEVGFWAYSDEVIGTQDGEPLYKPVKIGFAVAESGWLGIGDLWRADVSVTLREIPSVASVSWCSFEF